MSQRYVKARETFEALERIILLDDQVELDAERLALMQEPTKAKAALMYESAIGLWLQEHGETYREHEDVQSAIDGGYEP